MTISLGIGKGTNKQEVTSSPEVRKATRDSGSTVFISAEKNLFYTGERVPHPSGLASLNQISVVVVPKDVHLHPGAEKVEDLVECVLLIV